MDIADVSRVPVDVLRNVEADTYWCMSRLLDGIQVSRAAGAPSSVGKMHRPPPGLTAHVGVRRERPKVWCTGRGSVEEAGMTGLGRGPCVDAAGRPSGTACASATADVPEGEQGQPVTDASAGTGSPWRGSCSTDPLPGARDPPTPAETLEPEPARASSPAQLEGEGSRGCSGAGEGAARRPPGPDWACWCSQRGVGREGGRAGCPRLMCAESCSVGSVWELGPEPRSIH